MRRGIYILLFALALFCGTVTAQTTRVRGRVVDAATKKPLDAVSVVFPGTTVGALTDEKGLFAIEFRDTVSRVQAMCIGYETQTVPVKPRAFNTVEIKLTESGFDIEDVVILSGPNPAHPLLDSVNKYKYRNDPSRLERYSVSTYTKMELGLSNIKKTEFKSKRMQKNFGFIFNHVDTSAMTGQAYLPMMISESRSKYYRSKSPEISREVVESSRISGFDDSQMVAQFTGQLYADVNFYDNYIDLFNIRFAGPLSQHGRMLYNYFLVDSMHIDGRKTYKIRFHPKGLATPVLDGEVNIDSATYALHSAHVHMPKGQNVNWIRHLIIDNENVMLNDTLWFRSNDRLSADFSVVMADSSKMSSFIGTREVHYSNLKMGELPPNDVMRMHGNIVAQDEVTHNDEAYWDSVRPYELSEKEKSIYRMVDSVQHAPLYRDIYAIINTVLGGHYNTKYIGIGPYFRLISFNKQEGFRAQIGGRTTKEFSPKVRLSGFVAYGTRDEAVKGGAAVELMFRKSLTRKMKFEYKHDMAQMGESNHALSGSNILGSVMSRGNKRLSMIDEASAAYEHEWRHGFSNTLSVVAQNIHANPLVPLVWPDGTPADAVGNLAVRLGMRLSFHETILRQAFDKIYMRTDYPVIGLDVTAGIKGVIPGSYDYCSLSANVNYRLSMPPIGYSNISLQGGHIFGQVPYILLKLPEGNSTYFYDRFAFSCMNFYEFAADSWATLFYEHHFNGFLLGKIPLLKRMKMREVLVFKGIYGTLSDKNDGSMADTRAVMYFPPGMTSLSKPYMEMGFGIENIFRVARIDFIWRLTHRDASMYQDVQNFAVNLSVNLHF